MSARILLVLALAMPGLCLAQATVGELTQQGGKKLSKEELQQLHAGGVTYKGTLPSGAQFSQQNKADGSATGNVVSPRGSVGLFGGWKIDDAGKLCVNMKISSGGGLDSCSFIWKAGDRYFSSVADASDTALQVRGFEK